MTQQFTASEVHERERFEEWYTIHACNYSRDPIGSRDCSLQWESWKAALAAHSAQAQPPAVSVTDAIARRMVAEYDAVLCGDPTATRTDGMRAALEAALAAQENPNG